MDAEEIRKEPVVSRSAQPSESITHDLSQLKSDYSTIVHVHFELQISSALLKC